MTLLDAFAAAKPVVVSDVAPVRLSGPWCRAVDSGDAASFARNVRELWADALKRFLLGTDARVAASKRFSERQMALRIEEILISCTAGRRSCRPSTPERRGDDASVRLASRSVPRCYGVARRPAEPAYRAGVPTPFAVEAVRRLRSSETADDS